jgi:hypothetical protein
VTAIMELRNQTACHTLAFKGRSIDDEPFHVVVLRGTWSIPRGGAMRLLPEQEPLVMADVFHGEPGALEPARRERPRALQAARGRVGGGHRAGARRRRDDVVGGGRARRRGSRRPSA